MMAKILRWFSDGKVVIGLIVGAVLAAGSLADAFGKIEVFLGLKPDALEIADRNFKHEFSRDFTVLAWRRMYWMSNFIENTRLGADEERLDEVWDGYLAVLEEWNAQLMKNILLIQQYYGEERRNEFEYKIQVMFGRAHGCLVALRTGTDGSAGGACGPGADGIATARDMLSEINNEMYFFVSRTHSESVSFDSHPG
jgi:hypothetical protein